MGALSALRDDEASQLRLQTFMNDDHYILSSPRFAIDDHGSSYYATHAEP